MKKVLILFFAIAIPTLCVGQRRSSSSHRSSGAHSHSSAVHVRSHQASHTRSTSAIHQKSTRTSHLSKVSILSRRSPSQVSSKKAMEVERDNNGKIKRSSSAKERFMKQTGYPKVTFPDVGDPSLKPVWLDLAKESAKQFQAKFYEMIKEGRSMN